MEKRETMKITTIADNTSEHKTRKRKSAQKGVKGVKGVNNPMAMRFSGYAYLLHEDPRYEYLAHRCILSVEQPCAYRGTRSTTGFDFRSN